MIGHCEVFHISVSQPHAIGKEVMGEGVSASVSFFKEHVHLILPV